MCAYVHGYMYAYGYVYTNKIRSEGRSISGNHRKFMDLHPDQPQRNRTKPLVLLVFVSAVSVSQSVYTCVVYMYFMCLSTQSTCSALQSVGPRGRELQQPWCCRATGFSLPQVTTSSQLCWLDSLCCAMF